MKYHTMNLKKIVSIAVVVLLVTSCILGTGGKILAEEISENDFANMSYISLWTESGQAALVDGEYREAAAPGSATETVIRLTDKKAVGRIDDTDIAVVVLVTDPGGSGTFYDLALLVKENGAWVNSDTIDLGDRVQIHALAIEHDEIIVDMTTHGPEDQLCCPSRETRQTFLVKDERLVKPVDPRLLDVLWKWQKTVSNDDSQRISPDPERYTVTFRADGTLAIQADCNQLNGSYETDSASIAIEPLMMTTMALCPPGSLAQDYLKDLGAAAIYFLENEGLYFDLQYDSGTMQFSK